MSHHPTPMVLVILDGWGHRVDGQYNAIQQAHTPTWDALWETYPHTLLDASGPAVGLPVGQMGNSEVGHMSLAAGRVVPQDFTRITEAVETGAFSENAIFIQAIDDAISNHKTLHIMGLVSPGGVHSHESHLYALIRLASARGCQKLNIHAFLDGRDCSPKSAKASLLALEKQLETEQCGRIVSIMGRYYAMDRDNRWTRTQAAYDCMVSHAANYTAQTAIAGLEAAYARGETDEFVQPTCITSATDELTDPIEDGDSILFFNFRSDRARQLTRAFIDPNFSAFNRSNTLKLKHVVSMTQYAKAIKTEIAFLPQQFDNTLGEIFAQAGLRQLRVAETEKYAHVTFFFNGGREEPFERESRQLVASPNVATYDLQPEMSAEQITEVLLEAIGEQTQDVIICNFANPDMVGHTGDMPAAVKAIETIDACLGKLVKALKACGGEMIITADHGNAECMFDEAIQQPHTAHTTELVPFIYVGRAANVMQGIGKLSDVAPTLLHIMSITPPEQMTGRVLMRLKDTL